MKKEPDLSSNSVLIRNTNASIRVINLLEHADIFTLGEVLEKSKWELIYIRGFGKKSYQEMSSIMEEFGLPSLPPLKNKKFNKLPERYEKN